VFKPADPRQHAYTYGENSPGSASVEADFDVLPDEEADAANDNGDDEAVDWRQRAGLISAVECVAEATKKRPYIIKHVLAERDFMCIFGAPRAGKSLLAPYLCQRIAAGEPVFGHRTRAGTALYIAAEDAAGMEQRTAALIRVYGQRANWQVLTRISDLRDKGQRRVVDAAIKELRPAVIVIDTLARAFAGIDENTSDGMGEVIKICRGMTKWGAAVILIHHNPKDGGRLPRGHSSLHGDLDDEIFVEQNDATKTVSATLVKNRNGGDSCLLGKFRITPHNLGADEDGDPITAAYAAEVDGEAAARTATDWREQIDWNALNFIAHTLPSEFTNAALGKTLGVTRDSARSLVRKLGAVGWVNKPKHGKPVITPAGHARLEQNGERLFGFEASGDGLAA
jgi:hypothetical protein